jgi:hypothetical protein
MSDLGPDKAQTPGDFMLRATHRGNGGSDSDESLNY